MYRFLVRPRWIAFTVVCAAAVFAMVQLSMWQLRRLDERRDFNSAVSERLAAEPVPLTDPSALTLDDEWTNVIVTGTFDDTEQLEPSAGAYRVIGRLNLADGQSVLVERGTVPTTAEDAPPPPAGTVEVVGHIRRTPSDHGVLAPADGSAARVMMVQATSSDPADSPELSPLPPPDTSDEGPHLSYAVQWVIFAICVAIGWVLAVRRSGRTRRDAEIRAAAGRDDGRGGDGPRADGSSTDEASAPTKQPARKKHQAVPWRD